MIGSLARNTASDLLVFHSRSESDEIFPLKKVKCEFDYELFSYYSTVYSQLTLAEFII